MPTNYKLNPHQHVKIWLSKNPSVFMNDENQLRLVQMRAACPNDQINLIYDSQLLSMDAHERLLKFSLTHDFQAHNVREIIPKCTTDTENKLISIYEDEISHLDEGGNLAAASDVLRWLKPIYCLGIYSDLDVRVSTKNLPRTIPVFEEILLNIGNSISDEDEVICNNNIIAILNLQSEKIEKTHQFIINAYAPASRIPEFVGDLTIFFSEEHKQYNDYLTQLQDMCLGKTPRQFRANISAFCRCLKELEKDIRKNHISHDRIPMSLDFANLLDQCNRNSPHLQRNLYLDSVTKTTGPVVVDNLLPKAFDVRTINEVIFPYSMSFYKPLSHAFSPLISLRSKERFENTRDGDLSWISTRHIARREKKLHENAQKIQRIGKNYIAAKTERMQLKTSAEVEEAKNASITHHLFVPERKRKADDHHVLDQSKTMRIV